MPVKRDIEQVPTRCRKGPGQQTVLFTLVNSILKEELSRLLLIALAEECPH